MSSSSTEKSSVTATLQTKQDAAAEIEWRLKEMEGGRREVDAGLEMVRRRERRTTNTIEREYGEDEERKRRRERNARFSDTWVKNLFSTWLPKSPYTLKEKSL